MIPRGNVCILANNIDSQRPGTDFIQEGLNTQTKTTPKKVTHSASQDKQKVILSRYYNSTTKDYWVTTRQNLPSQYKRQGSVHIYSPVHAQPSGTKPIYSCLVAGKDHMVSGQANCEGTTALDLGTNAGHKLGYIKIQKTTGTIPLYRCIYNSNHYVSNSATCEKDIPAEGLGGYAISLANLPTGTSVETPTETETKIPSITEYPIPGSGPFGFAPNTPYSGIYFTSKLRQRALDYDYVKSTYNEWVNLSSELKARSLYWQNNKLWSVNKQGIKTLIDDLSQSPFIPADSNIKLTISNRLASSHITGYPGCAFAKNELVHPQACNHTPYSNKYITGSEIFSQRWTRPNKLNLDHIPSDYNKKDIFYELNVAIGAKDAMPDQVLKKFPINYELSISKVPGDFSSNACKPNLAIKYSGGFSILLKEEGYKSYDLNLPKNCIVNFEKSQHFYVNVRVIKLDLERKEIVESDCHKDLMIEIDSPVYINKLFSHYEKKIVPVNCKFQILDFLD